MVKLLLNSDNATGAAHRISDFTADNIAHWRTIFIYGDFDGGTVKIEVSPNNIDFFDVTGLDAVTSKTVENIEFRAGFIRASLSGATAGSINVDLI